MYPYPLQANCKPSNNLLITLGNLDYKHQKQKCDLNFDVFFEVSFLLVDVINAFQMHNI